MAQHAIIGPTANQYTDIFLSQRMTGPKYGLQNVELAHSGIDTISVYKSSVDLADAPYHNAGLSDERPSEVREHTLIDLTMEPDITSDVDLRSQGSRPEAARNPPQDP